MKDIGSGFAHLSPVGVGIKPVITNHHLALIGNMGGHSGDKLQITLVVALASVAVQTIKTAIANPAKSLRYE